MKHLLLTIISLFCALATASAQDGFTSPYFESAEARDAACKHAATIYTEDWSDMPDQSKEYEDFGDDNAKYPNLHFRRMRNRRALVGENCTVNKLITVVGVGGWSKTMNALTDEDLEDYAEFNKVVSAGVTVDPIVSIRDMKNYYAKGTKAGYCIVAGSGNAVLTLDVIKAMSIGFYRDGKLLGVKAVKEGQDGEGITLKLIQIPGSDEACIMLTAESDWLFDEISLDHSGGVQVGVGDLLKVKYAFVGDSYEYPITYDGTDDNGATLKGGISQYNDYLAAEGNADAEAQLDYVKGWDPVLLGLPFPFTDKAMQKFTDYDTSNYIAITPILSVGYQGGAKFMMKRSDGSDGEVFGKGMEVGFNYNVGSGLALDAGAWIRLILFDRNGNKVQEETVSAGVLNLSVAKGGNGTASVTAEQPFSGCEIRFHTVLSVDLGAIGIHYGFVKNKPEVPHHCAINPSPDTDKTYVANIGVGNWLTVETYYRGKATGDKKSDWSVLGADVAGYGDKDYLFVQPKHIYDEVRITIGGVIDAAKPQKFYGLFLRGDVDNDGIPDCKDPNSCSQEPLKVEVSQVCVGDKIKIKAQGYVDTDYTIEFGEPDIDDVTLKSDATNGYINYEYVTKTPGQYQMMFYDGSGNFINSADYTVYPRQTTWLTNASNNDWNKWDNWSNGAPYCCTNAIIPSGAKHYPVLDASDVKTGDEYCCNDIFFEPQSAIERTQQLNYSRAWVETEMLPNRYYNFSAPLKQMYTGDMFVNTSVEDTLHTFCPLNADTYPAQRFNPTIYQRLWLATEKSHKWTTGNADDDYLTVDVDANNWSHHFNNLAYNYAMGTGIAVWVDEGTSGKKSFRFRFPKEHTEYSYFSDYDQQPIDGAKETIERDDVLPHRFIYEEANDNNITMTTADGDSRTVYNAQQEYDITLKADKATTTFMMGNPFMSHIDIGHMLNYNTNVKGAKIEQNGTLLTVTRDDDGSFVYSGNVSTIAPMQSIFLETDEPATSLNVVLTPDMLSASDNDATAALPSAAPQLHISANGASMVLVDSKKYTSATLFDSEVRPTQSVFAINGGNAYDIMPIADNVKLGLCMAEQDTVTFSFRTANGFRRDDYSLKDNLTGMAYPIDEDVTIADAGTSIGRFAIVKNSATATPAIKNCADDMMITLSGRKATVKSTKPISSIIVSDAAGHIVTTKTNINSSMAETEMTEGINIIKTYFDDGTSKSHKLWVKLNIQDRSAQF